MGASDYMVGNAPASYAVPLRNFLEPLQQGFDFGQKYKLQKAFADGLPLDAKGQPDLNAIQDKLLQVGGANYASQLLPYIYGQKAGEQDAAAIRNGAPLGDGAAGFTAPRVASISPGTTGPNAGPGNLTPPQASAAPAQPKLSSMGTDDAGSDTVRSLATELFGGRDVSGLISSYSKSAGLSPDAPLNPAQASQFKTFAQKFAQNARGQTTATDAAPNGASAAPFVAGGTDGAPAPPASGPRAAAPASAPGTTPGTTAPPFAPGMTGAGPGATAPSPGATAAGPGAPTAGPGATAAPPGPPAASNAAAPPGFTTAAADNRERYATNLYAQAATLEGLPGGGGKDRAANLRAAADKQMEVAKQIREYLAREGESTPEMKTARSEGLTPSQLKMREEQNKQDAVTYSKQHIALVGAGNAAAQMIPHLELARSYINNPSFYSGPAEGVNLFYKRAVSALGGDPNAPVPQEGFRKVMAANILDQVAQMKADAAASGATSSRIFQSQIALMERAAQNPENTIAANRLLTEIGFRAANRSLEIADMADKYNNGHLDAGFNVKIRDYDKKHPLFTPQELADTRLLSAPRFPTAAEAARAKLPAASLVIIDGKPYHVPGAKPQ